QSFDQSEIRYLSADRPTEAWRTLVPRTPGVLYPVAEHRGDDFLVLSNEHALNFKLLRLSDRDPTHASELVPASDSILLDGIDVLGGYEPSHYGMARAWATAKDGARIPLSLVYRNPFVKDGTRPLLLYAYGSYGISTDPTFSSNLVSLLDRGVVYAVAHIRGGQEMGRQWYEQGRLLNKKNTFSDFIAAAEHLVAER